MVMCFDILFMDSVYGLVIYTMVGIKGGCNSIRDYFNILLIIF